MQDSDKSDRTYPQYTLLKSLILHILPGALVTMGFMIFKPLLESSGYPPLLAFLLAILLIDLPFMWVILLYEGWKENGRIGLKRVVLYREKLPWKSFLVIFVGAFIAAFGLITLTNPLTSYLKESLFSGLPQWLFLEEQAQYQAYPKNVLVITFLFQLILTGVALPWTEELYFRGYLLPRLSRFGMWAPLIGGLLFGLYHSWQAFGFASVFLLGIVLGYVVWWKHDLRLGISLHIVANTAARLAFLMAALAM